MASRKRTHKPDLALRVRASRPADLPNPRRPGCAFSWGALPKFGARGELHLERRSFARRRHHPDAPAVHLDDLFGDGEPEPRAALGLGKRAVDLVELIKDPILLIKGYARPGVRHRDGEM